MLVKEIMTENPACCVPQNNLMEVAKVMLDYDCGAVPIIENNHLVGIITDRDIALRAIAERINPEECKVSDCMSKNVITVNQNSDVNEVIVNMESNQIRRIVVVDDNDKVCGIVSQADIALKCSNQNTANVFKQVSK